MTEPWAEVFVGRDDELDAARRWAVEARHGRPRTIVVSGPAGVGKSALVRRLVAELADFEVIRAAADPMAVDESMWLAGQLADVPSAGSAFGMGLAVLAKLADRQSEGPVALIIEDLHWADDDSRRALLTTLRRLEGDRVLAIVTTRPDPRADNDAWARLTDDPERGVFIPLGPLSPAEVSALADRTDVALGPNAAVRLHRHTGGLALYVRMLLRELTPSQLNAFGSLPAPQSLALATVGRIAKLPPDSIELVRALSVLGRPSPLAALGQVAGVADPTAALDGALASGFVEWQPSDTGPVVSFVHPLYATAVYDDISPVRRRSIHLAAAEIDLGGALAHRIAAADRVDAALAADLQDAAATTTDPALAARYLSAAAGLSESPPEAMERLVAAGLRHLEAGNVQALSQLRTRLEAGPASSERDVVLGWLAWQTGDTDRAETLLRIASDGAAGTPGRTEALLQLGSLYAFQGRGSDAIDAGRTTLAVADLGADEEELAWRLIAGGVNQAEGGVAGIAVLDGRYGADTEPESLDPNIQWAYAVYETCAGRPRTALTWFDRLIAEARNSSISRHLPHIHMMKAQCHYRVGEWDAALLHANAAIDLANDEAQTWLLGHVNAVASWVLAGRGQWELADRRLDHARAGADAVPINAATILSVVATGLLARARAQPEAVVAALSPLTAGDGEMVSAASNLGYWPALIHALIDLERLDTARDELQRFRAAADFRRIDLRTAQLTLDGRLLAATGDASTATTSFETALDAVTDESEVLDRIILHHYYGRHLRASGRRRDAIVQLASAHDLATRIGAVPFAERIDTDLRGVEAATKPAVDDPLATLTTRERDVVTLIAGGATNREAATALYVSVKAIEYHLGNVYAKLHLTSRRQLKALVAPA